MGREVSTREQENQIIYHDVLELFLASRMSAEARRIAKYLSQMYGRAMNRKRISRIMRENGLVPKGKKKHVVTTNSKDSVNIFPNLLKCDFTADARNQVGKKHLEGCILHSDRGSTYASNAYIEKMDEYKMIGSMSRTGNCWDNAPIESFWGRMKVEWLDSCYKTKEEAISNVYEYI